MERRGNISIGFAAGALAIFTLPAAVAAHPRRGAIVQSREVAAQLVVMIQGTIGDAPTTGAGIIIGLANDQLYVATANHVVRRGVSEAKDLKVQLKWRPGELIPANLLMDADVTLDLGVIAVPDAGRLRAPRFTWQALTRPDPLTRGTKVFPIGYPGGNAWLIAVQPHLVSAVTTSLIRAEGNLVDGHSGGALVTEDGGIVGLVSNVDPVIGESQRIDRVVEKLVEWGYPVSLTWKPASPAEPRVAETTGEVVTIRTSGRFRSFDFRTKMIGDDASGADFYFSGRYPAFWANNRGQRGVADLGKMAGPLDKIDVPSSGYSRQNVNAVVGNTYAALAGEGHEGDVIVFRVLDIGYSSGTTEFYRIEFSYRSSGARPDSERVIVPNVVGLDIKDAQHQLVAAGLRPGPEERHALRRYNSGTVYSQTPDAGAQIDRGDLIKLYIDITPAPEYQAAGSMSLTSGFVFDLDWDQTDRGQSRTSPDFRFGTENGWQLQPENGALIAEVPAGTTSCSGVPHSTEPVNLTFRTDMKGPSGPVMAVCVLTNQKRFSLLRVRKGRTQNEILVEYSTWRSTR